jgi:putative peptidoglycan lipid II flippase
MGRLSGSVASPRRVTSESGDSLSLYSVWRSALVLTGGAAAIQVLGIVRELFLATQIGASAHLDALLIALSLPAALPSVLTSGTATALVPAYLEARQAAGVAEARRLAGTVLIWVSIGGAGIWVALTAFAGFAVALTGPGLSAAGRVEAVSFLQLLAPIAFVTSISPILFAVCQAEGRFVAMSAASFAGAATTLATMVILWDSIGLYGLAIGLLAGPIVNVTILLGSMMRASLVPLPGLRSRGRLGPFVRHAAPLTFGAAILQLNVVIDRAVASLVGPGAVSVLRYADVLVRVPIGAIGPAWGSAIYPALVRSTLGGAADRLALDAQRAIRFTTAVFVPVAMLTAAVAPLAVKLAYGRGAFSVDALYATAGAVAAFAPLLLLLMVQPVLVGAHNARRHGRLLATGASMNVILNSILDIVLGISFGVIGVALSSSITVALVLAFFAWRLSISEADFTLRPIAATIGLAIVASAPVTIVAALVCWTGLAPSGVVPGIAVLLGIAVLGVIGYVFAATWLGMEEPRTLARRAFGRLFRGRMTGGAD